MNDARPSSPHPFELFTLGLCVLAGLPLLFGDARPGSIAELLTDVQGDLWGGMLVFGAFTCLTGIFWPNRITGIVLEQVGLVAVGLASLFYAVVVLVSVGLTGAYATLYVVGFGLSCLWRYFQLLNYLRTLRHLSDQEESAR